MAAGWGDDMWVSRSCALDHIRSISASGLLPGIFRRRCSMVLRDIFTCPSADFLVS